MSPMGELRIDKLLWFLRLTKTRGAAQALVLAGHLRCNGTRIARAAHMVVPGDVLTVPLGQSVQIIELDALPTRRGPPAEARACYRTLDRALDGTLDVTGAYPIAAGGITAREGTQLP